MNTASASISAIPRERRSAQFQRAKQPDFKWCIQCERAYQFGEFRRDGMRQLCPYVSCAAAEIIAWDWDKVRSANPHYPGQPSLAVVYPLFGRGVYTRAC